MASNQDINNQEKLNKLLNNSRASQRSFNEALRETKSLSDQLMSNLKEEALITDFKDRRLRSEKDLTAKIQKEKRDAMKAEGNFSTLRKKQMDEYRKGNIDQAVQLGRQAKRQEEVTSRHFFVRATAKDFNATTNETYYTESTAGVKQIISGLRTDPKTYITTVGMYNDDNELLAIAKLSQPILKSKSREALIKVKLDF